MKSIISTAAASLLFVTSSHAAVLVSFFDGIYSNDTLLNSAQNIHVDVTSTDMSRVISGGDPGGSGGTMRNSFGAANFGSPTTFFFTYNGANAPTTVGDTSYMQFQVTADAGLTLDLSNITLDWAWATDADTVDGWTSSLDVTVSTDGTNFSTVTGSARSASTGSLLRGDFGYFTGGEGLLIDMSSLANAAEYTIRIRSADSTTSNSHAASLFQNITLNGAAVIPEPSAALLGGLGLLVLLRRRRD